MARYAVIKEEEVINVIIADSIDIAESVTGLMCVEYTGENPAGIGWGYNSVLGKFIAPKPYPSWILNETTCVWEAPTPLPDNENVYVWNEETVSWDLVPTPTE